MKANKTYLVLGANGFIGSYVVDRLSVSEGVLVRAFDRFDIPPQFVLNDAVEVVKGDIYADTDILQALDGVDYVYHSFSATTPYVSDSDPYIDITKNLLRSVQILSRCVEAGVKKIAFISSGGAVYGATAEKKVVDEEDAPLPVSPYGINKLAIEHYLEYFSRKNGLEYVVYRLSNPFGPRQVVRNNQGVIPNFLHNILSEQEITVYGDGTMSRDYIYIKDAIEMMCTSFVDGRQTLYNIGRGEQTSINQIIESLRELLPNNVRVKYAESPKSFLQRTDISIERYVEEFGLPEFTPLTEGLAETYSWLRTET